MNAHARRPLLRGACAFAFAAGLAASALAQPLSLQPGARQAPPAAQAKPAAQTKPAAPAASTAKPAAGGALANFGGGSKEPIKIDADRLDVFDRDKRAVFQGNVVAVQGETTIRCTTMTVYYEQSATGRAQGATPAAAPAGGGGDSAIRQVDCTGPVTVVSKDQVATGDNAVFDRVANIVTLSGNAALSQGPNVTRGERVIYNLDTGIANVEGGRVRALFVPGSEAQTPGTGAPAASPRRPGQKPPTN